MTYIFREMTKAIGTGIGVAAISMVVFFILAAASLLIPRDVIVNKIAQGFETGWVTTNDYPDERLGRDQYTDCVVFQMAMRDDAGFMEELASPRWYDMAPDEKEWSPCTWLKEAVDQNLDVTRPKLRYHRYIHGSTILTRFMLMISEVHTYRVSIKSLNYFLLFMPLVILVYQVLSRGNLSRSSLPQWTGRIILAATFPAFFAIEQNAMSVSRGPCSIILFLGLFVFVVWGPNCLASRKLWLLTAIFGALTAIIEFFDVGSPLGLALILGILALYGMDKGNESLPHASVKILGAAITYVTALITCLVLKIALAIGVYGNVVISDFLNQFSHRLGGKTWYGAESTAAEVFSRLLPHLDILVHNWQGSGQIIILLTAGLGVIGIIGLIMTLERRKFMPFIVLLAASLLVVPVWYLVFRNETADHAWIFVRLLAWPMSFSCVVFGYFVTMFYVNHRQGHALYR